MHKRGRCEVCGVLTGVSCNVEQHQIFLEERGIRIIPGITQEVLSEVALASDLPVREFNPQTRRFTLPTWEYIRKD